MAITGYNANPPPNDGSQVESNEIVWEEISNDGRGIKTNLTDPLFNEITAIETTGLPIVPGSDIDVNLITLTVTGTPILKWDELNDSFDFNKILTINDGSLFIKEQAAPETARAGFVQLYGELLTPNRIKAVNDAGTQFILGMTQGALIATTSGTSADAVIPTEVKLIIVPINAVVINGTSDIMLQLGIGAGIQASGYLTSVGTRNATDTPTTGFEIQESTDASNAVVGTIILALADPATDTWAITGVLHGTNQGLPSFFGGTVVLGGEITTVRITTSGGVDSLNGGSFTTLTM